MRIFLNNIWSKIGIGLVIFGWGPLLLIILLSSIGLWPDPNPNPIGPGLLFAFTSWPAVICLVVGAIMSAKKKSQGELMAIPTNSIPETAVPEPQRQIPLTTDQSHYLDSAGWGPVLGFMYYILMGTPGAFFSHLPGNFNYVHSMRNGRRYVWEAKTWASFEVFQVKNNELDQNAKYLTVSSIILLVIFFAFIEMT